MGALERWVRKAVDHEEEARNREALRLESQAILAGARQLDRRLALAEQERDRAWFEFERLLNFLPALLIIKDTEGTLKRVNRYAALGFDLKPEDMEGQNQRRFWPPEQCDQFAHDDAEVMLTRKGKYGYLEPATYRGHARTFRTWKVPTYSASGRVNGVMLFAVDLDAICDPNCTHLNQEMPL